MFQFQLLYLSNHMHHCIMFRFQLMHCSLTRPTVSSPTQLKHRRTTWTYLMQCSRRILGKNMHPLHQNPFRFLVHNMLWDGNSVIILIFILVIPPLILILTIQDNINNIKFMDRTYRLCFQNNRFNVQVYKYL